MGRIVATPLGQAPLAHVSGSAIFPGAFHPLHAGHRRMAQIAREWLGMPVQFELSVFNVDKPPLNYWEISDRVQQFDAGETLWDVGKRFHMPISALQTWNQPLSDPLPEGQPVVLMR